MLTSNKLNINYDGNLMFITFPGFENTGKVSHAFSTRLVGVSEGQYAGMNLSFYNGDSKENVQENFARICNAAGINYKKMIFSQQTHTSNVEIVKDDKDYNFNDVDGLITSAKGIALVTQFADCVPLIFLDHKKDVIASSHAGWKGTAGEIGLITVGKMVSNFGCDVKDIIAAVGPCICKECYEVDEPVIKAFKKIKNLGGSFIKSKGGGKYLLDLAEANRQILIKAGLKDENITVSDICTCCNSEYLHSHRATAGKRGNLAMIIMLK